MDKKTINWKKQYLGRVYDYNVINELYNWEKVIRVICNWAWMDEIFDKEDLDLVINEIIPTYIDIKLEDKKTENLQVRLRKRDKDALKKLAKEEKVSVSDLIVNKILS